MGTAMDLSKRSELTVDEAREVTELLQYAVLSELFDATQWTPDQAVFHGGTSLRVVRESDRYSEDLDFLISPDVSGDLARVMVQVREGLLTRLALSLPGSEITVKQSNKKEGSSVIAFTVRWEHAMRMGAVRVKTEFYQVPKILHESYSAEDILPTRIPDVAVGFKAPIPAPKLIYAWADKIKAIATRDFMKYRDVYDVWFLLGKIRPLPEGDEAREAVSRVASLYDHTPESVAEGLDRVLASDAISDNEAFQADMKRWLPEDIYRGLETRNYFPTILAAVRDELARARTLISEPPCPKM